MEFRTASVLGSKEDNAGAAAAASHLLLQPAAQILDLKSKPQKQQSQRTIFTGFYPPTI